MTRFEYGVIGGGAGMTALFVLEVEAHKICAPLALLDAACLSGRIDEAVMPRKSGNATSAPRRPWRA